MAKKDIDRNRVYQYALEQIAKKFFPNESFFLCDSVFYPESTTNERPENRRYFKTVDSSKYTLNGVYFEAGEAENIIVEYENEAEETIFYRVWGELTNRDSKLIKYN